MARQSALPQKGIEIAVEPDIWHWANAQGQPISIRLSDLRSALARGAMPASTWVWKKGWRHWLPAFRVEELKTALGSRARESQVPALDLKQLAPPKVPTSPNEPNEIEPPRRSTPVPPAPRGHTLARRPAAPTVTNELPTAIATLRPPGAVPPPPRGIPRSAFHEFDDWEPTSPEEASASASIAPSSKSSRPVDLEAKPASTSLRIGSPASTRTAATLSNPTLEVPESEVSAPAHAPVDNGNISYDPEAVPGHGNVPLSPTPAVTRSLFPLRNNRYIVWWALAIGSASLVAGAWLLLQPTRSKALPVPTAHLASRATETPLGCRIERTAERVAPRVHMPVTPIALDAPYGRRVALGFAESPTTAAGIAIDPVDLSVQFPYRELQDKKILSVVPQVLNGALSYVTVREGIPLAQARAVASNQQFLFGTSPTGLSRQLAGQAPEVVWPLEDKAIVTDPRIVTVSGLGHAVTFRQGGTNGTLRLGLLTATGQSLRPPVLVPAPVTLLGTPTIAASVRGESKPKVLLAFAGRSSEAEPWSLYLNAVDWDAAIPETQAFTLPEGGPGADAISPSVAALPNGHWLLQWSEGPTGQRQIRVQLLDATLRPLGKVLAISPVGTNSGQGLLWSDANRAVSFFVISSGKQTELWASSLVCSK